MCGLTGFFQPAGIQPAFGEEVLNRQTDALFHRGPDDAGTWLDSDAGIALGHRRLSVLDLSHAGHQPMASSSGRYAIVFNGEIYNHLELREALEKSDSRPTWRGNSDTETLLASFECWGIEAALRKVVGMFAVALWDRHERTLTLARDRLGEKPLYYGWQSGAFLFASELKALRRHPAFCAEVDRAALTAYMRDGYIAAPRSIYRNIRKLAPGTYLRVSRRDPPGTLPEPQAYWSLREVAESGFARPFQGDDVEACNQLEAVLKQAVSLQSVADVPLGAFLSGGVDSTTVVALMQTQLSRPVKTFTIGFHESDYQEAQYAKAVARHLKTDHTELHVTANEAMEVIPKLPILYDEPFGDSSAIPTFLVAQLARRDVTVSLSGDGGDELFAGYARYQRTVDTWRVMGRIPYSARKALSRGCRAIARLGRNTSVGWKADRLTGYLSARTGEECYRAGVERQDADALVLGADSAAGPNDVHGSLARTDAFHRMMYADTLAYLPDDILAKVDRAAMAVSLETRVPLLDHRVVEFVWRLPLHLKVRDREAKWLLKRVLKKHVPAAMVDRPKMGFGVPVGQWLRGPLRDWAEDLLGEDRLRRDGFLDPQVARARWSRHVDRIADDGDGIWPVLMFQAWLSGSVQSSTPKPVARAGSEAAFAS